MESASSNETGQAVVRVAGAAVGGFLSTVIGPEAGAAAGQAVMETTDRVISFLTQRARDRVDEVADLTRSEIERRINDGESLRDDGILAHDSEAGAEILEGILRSAVEAEGRRKCTAIANLATAIGFEEEVSAADALRYLRLLRSMSWRQLCALAYFADDSRADGRALISARGEEGDARVRPALEAELTEMARTFELIGLQDDRGGVNNPSDTWNGGGIGAATLTKVAPTALGHTLCQLTRLSSIVSPSELDDLERELDKPA